MTKLGNVVAARRSQMGMNQTELANAAEMTQKNISKIEQGLTAKPHNWRKLAKALQYDEAELATIIDESAIELGRPGKRATAVPRKVSEQKQKINMPHYVSVKKRLPILGRAAPGQSEKLVTMRTVYDTTEKPPELANVDGAYAVYVYGNSMEPRFFNGELLMVNPNIPLENGDFCIVQVDRDGDECGYIRRLVSQDRNQIVVAQINPQADLIFDSAEVRSVHKVVSMRVR